MSAVYVLIIAILILLNGGLALAEIAVVSSRRARLRERAEQKRPGARAALRLANDPNRFLSTVQIGITLVGVLAGAFGGATLAEPLGHVVRNSGVPAGASQTIAFLIVVISTVYFTVIIGELVPKRIAMSNPEWFAALVARPMDWLSRIARPLVWLLEGSTQAVLRCIGKHDTGEQNVSEEEIRSMIRESTRGGIVDSREQAMIDGVFRLDDRSVRSVMVPRPDVAWLDIDDDLPTIRDKIESNGFSRFLVCRGDIDQPAGVVRTRDILDVLMRGESLNLAACLVDPMTVLDSLSIIDLLDRFKNGGMHIAMVVDEYGSLAGIATMTDVIEVVAGNLPEHWEDTNGDAVQREDGVWEVNGMMNIEDFENVLGVTGMGMSMRDQTVAGFMLYCMEAMPEVGNYVYWNDIRFEVVEMQGHRIDKVLVTLTPEPEADQDEKVAD